MRKLIISSAVGGLVLAGGFLAPSALAANTSACSPAQAASAAQVCGSGDPAAQSGGIWIQGGGAVPGPVSHGYLGVNSTEGLVGCSNGTYNGSSDNVITAIPPAGPPAQPDPNGPCTPKP